MKIQLKHYCLIIALFVFCTALSGCGSGGASPSRTTKAKTSLKTAGLVASGLLVATLEVVVDLPYGVTVELDPLTSQPAKSVVQLVGTTDPAMTLNTLEYVAPTPTTKGSLRITYVAAAGFTPSDSIAISLDIANGFFPVASDFSLTKFEIGTMSYATDASGNKLLDSNGYPVITSVLPIAPVPNPNSLLTVSIV